VKVNSGITLQEAMEKGRQMPFAAINTYSGYTVGKTADTELPETEEIIEARFFDADSEIRIFTSDSGLQAVEVTDSPDDRTIEAVYSLRDSAKVAVRRYIGFDDDGQAYISYSRMFDYMAGGADK